MVPFVLQIARSGHGSNSGHLYPVRCMVHRGEVHPAQWQWRVQRKHASPFPPKGHLPKDRQPDPDPVREADQERAPWHPALIDPDHKVGWRYSPTPYAMEEGMAAGRRGRHAVHPIAARCLGWVSEAPLPVAADLSCRPHSGRISRYTPALSDSGQRTEELVSRPGSA